MILPIFAGLERIPDSLLEASSDLGGRGWIDVPPGHPAAGHPGRRRRARSSPSRLTLGDYIVPGLVSTTQFIGNVIVVNVAQNLPLAAAYSLVPLAIILVYLLVARRLGAFEAL